MIGERRNLDWLTPITCYWKNGQLIDLSDRTRTAGDQALTRSGNDLYMAWSESYNSSGQSQTRYSKNLGAPVLINDGSADVRGTAIAVSGSDVYIAGSAIGSNAIVAKYWKNGVPVALSNGPQSAFGQSIAVVGSDVYVAGYSDAGASGTAQYWKNGSVVTLINGNQAALIRKIVVVKK